MIKMTHYKHDSVMTMTASEARTQFGRLLDGAQREPITIEKNGQPFAVIMSKHEYDALQQELKHLRSETETAFLMRGANAERLKASIEAHRRGEPGVVKTIEELEAMAADED